MVYRLILLFIVIACSLDGQAQSLSKKIPSKHGVTHHFINEDKINLFKDANLAQKLIDDYKANITIGYTETGIGVVGLVFVGCFMDVPQWWSNGHHDTKAKQREAWRYGAAAFFAILTVDGTLRIGRNHKKLAKIQWTLQPTTGGVRFIF